MNKSSAAIGLTYWNEILHAHNEAIIEMHIQRDNLQSEILEPSFMNFKIINKKLIHSSQVSCQDLFNTICIGPTTASCQLISHRTISLVY